MTEAGAPPDDDVIVALARIVATDLGEDFLRRMVEVLRAYMRASLAFVGIGQGQPIERVHATFALRDGDLTELDYALEDVPCALVYRDAEPFVVPCDLAGAFPKEAGLESYIGVPMRGTDGATFGHLAVFSPDPLRAPERVLAILKVLAQRVEDEMRRRAVEAERERLIEDLRQQAMRLRDRQQTIRDQNAYKTRLLGIIAHDLRAPLAAGIAQAELAQALLAADPPRVHKAAAACARVVDRAGTLSDLIDATLRRVREEDRNLVLTRASHDLDGLLRLACDSNRAEAGRKSIRLELVAETGAQVSVDEDLFHRALDNLISNAVKYTAPGGWVRVESAFMPDGIRITVADNGQGLTPVDIDRAFGRFQTLSAKPTGGETSIGLGLSNVREIVEAHGGAVAVQSPGTGQGATFTVTLSGVPEQGPRLTAPHQVIHRAKRRED